MRSFYDFEGQINAMAHIFKEHVSLAQNINVFLKKMPKSTVSQIVRELKDQYEHLYNDQEDQQKLAAIKSTLNLAARQQATNLDSLFIELAEEINGYYKKQYFQIKKEIPFLLPCDICSQFVANDHQGCEMHKLRCSKKKQEGQVIAPQRKKSRKINDTIQMYQQRQILVNDSFRQSIAQMISQESSQQFCLNQKHNIKLSKLQAKKTKKEQKRNKNCIKSFTSHLQKPLLPKIEEKNGEPFEEQLSDNFSFSQNPELFSGDNSNHQNVEQMMSRFKANREIRQEKFRQPANKQMPLKSNENIYMESEDQFLQQI